jgi:hypothetical protein
MAALSVLGLALFTVVLLAASASTDPNRTRVACRSPTARRRLHRRLPVPGPDRDLCDREYSQTTRTAWIITGRLVVRITNTETGESKVHNFFDFPAEHWVHLKTSNPIESTFAPVRARTR